MQAETPGIPPTVGDIIDPVSNVVKTSVTTVEENKGFRGRGAREGHLSLLEEQQGEEALQSEPKPGQMNTIRDRSITNDPLIIPMNSSDPSVPINPERPSTTPDVQ